MRRLALAFGVALLGCAGAGFDMAALPSEPVAFVWRSEDEAARRAEYLERRRGGAPLEAGRGRLEDVEAWLGRGPTHEQRMADFQGRLALLDVGRESFELAGFAPRGAWPLDWSPDHGLLLFRAPVAGVPQLHEWDRAGDLVRVVTQGPEPHPAGCYGPDGRLAYVQVSRGASGFTSRILLGDTRGGAARPVTPGPRDGHPAWSPDGRWLLYGIDEEGDARIAALDLVAGGEPRIVARGRRPRFAPDGFAVYSSRTGKGWQLFRMRPDGSAKRLLGTGPLEVHAPTVSPDGRFVVYVAEEDDRQSLRLRSTDGRVDRPLVLRGDGLAPVWN